MLLTWPVVWFTNSESRNVTKDALESVALLGKKTSRPVYGQIVDMNEDRTMIPTNGIYILYWEWKDNLFNARLSGQRMR